MRKKERKKERRGSENVSLNINQSFRFANFPKFEEQRESKSLFTKEVKNVA